MKNLKSEAAIKRVIEAHKDRSIGAAMPYIDPIVELYEAYTGVTLAKVDLREFVKKRQPLRGINKRLRAAVNGKAKKGKK